MVCKDCGHELKVVQTLSEKIKYRCFNCGKYEIVDKKKSLKDKVRGWFSAT